MLHKLKDWASFLRDIGLIVGMPTMIVVGVHFYELQVDLLEQQNAVIEERNKLLQETQYDRALDIIRSQKELFELERKDLAMQLENARGSSKQDREEIARLERQLSDSEGAVRVIERLRIEEASDGGFLISTPVASIGVKG